jgi:hypothetical protein
MFFVTADVADIQARTDLGRSIRLFRYQSFALPVAGQPLASDTDADRRELLRRAEQQFLENTGQNSAELKQLRELQPIGNCHGWVFAHGQCGVHDSEVPTILADNGYEAVPVPLQGVLAVYTDDGAISHSGIVREVDPLGRPLVESKWGPFGVYLHAATAIPFRGVCQFYRSRRGGHGLAIRPTNV